jgi:hypothetical protein
VNRAARLPADAATRWPSITTCSYDAWRWRATLSIVEAMLAAAFRTTVITLMRGVPGRRNLSARPPRQGMRRSRFVHPNRDAGAVRRPLRLPGCVRAPNLPAGTSISPATPAAKARHPPRGRNPSRLPRSVRDRDFPLAPGSNQGYMSAAARRKRGRALLYAGRSPRAMCPRTAAAPD